MTSYMYYKIRVLSVTNGSTQNLFTRGVELVDSYKNSLKTSYAGYKFGVYTAFEGNIDLFFTNIGYQSETTIVPANIYFKLNNRVVLSSANIYKNSGYENLNPLNWELYGSNTLSSYDNGDLSTDGWELMGTVVSANYIGGVSKLTLDTTPCFRQGTKILRINCETGNSEYVPVEELRKGDALKTVNNGLKSIQIIGRREIPNPLSIVNKSSRLYWLRKSKVVGLTEDLCVTGDHCILYKSITDEKKDQILRHMGDIYITENHYRVPAFLDNRVEPYEDNSPTTIWHFALENNNIYHNYGIYANGLLVETSSINYMQNHSNMKLM